MTQLWLDIYNATLTKDDMVATIERCPNALAHVQLTGIPCRHELDEMRYMLAPLEARGYDRCLGREYRSLTDTSTGLNWTHRYLAGAEA
jgi:hydroxypyruvate isomerase